MSAHLQDRAKRMRAFNADPTWIEARNAKNRERHLQRLYEAGLMKGAEDLYRLAQVNNFRKCEAIQFANDSHLVRLRRPAQ
jgi:hypothetical protein